MTTTSTSKATDHIEITSGPGAGELWDAAKYAFSDFTVTFSGTRWRGRIRGHVQIKMQIIGIRHEDGSGGSFIVSANIIKPGNDPAFEGLKTFYYNARRREGHLKLTQ